LSTQPARATPNWLAEAVGFVALAAVAASLGLLWLWAGLAGVLFGDGWPDGLTLADHARVAFTLPSHLGDPRAAWPATARPALPSALGFYAALAAILVATGALIAAVSYTKLRAHETDSYLVCRILD
jgi:hypothetical protein